jgi:hypothetical protein
MKILLIFYYYNFLYKATTIKVIMPIVLGNSNISYKENKSSINPYNALLFKNQKVGIGVDINSVLNHSLEVNGDINISSNSKYIINNANFGYSNLDHKLSAGTNISIDADFKINNTYTLPIASSSVIGGIIVGSNLSIDANGFLSTPSYTLPIASGAVMGGVRVGNNLSIDANGILSTPIPTLYILPTASDTVIGGVRVGNNLSIDANGFLSTHVPYTLPTASSSVIGGVKVGTNLSIDANGFLSTHVPYTLPTASSSVIGGVKVGSNLSIDASGILSAPTPYTLPTSSVSIIGGVKVGNNLSIDANGILSAPTPYTLPIASDTVIGGVKVGSNLSIDANGILSTPTPYTLPIASGAVMGGVRVGNNLSIDASGILSAPPPYTLPTSSEYVIGGVKVGNNLSITGGVLSAPTPYTLPTASSSAIGGIRVGSNLSIDAGGILSTHTPYTLPTASDTIIGSVKVDGTTIAINTGVISYTGGIAQWGTSGNNIHNTNTLNVGIGTTNPQSRLHIYNNISGSTSLNINNIGPGSSVIELRKGDVDDAYSDFKIGNYDGDFFVKSSINGIDSDYIKMLGTNGAIYNFNNSLNWTQTSDRRIKENIEIASYDKCYENIDKLELNSFNYIKEFKTGNRDTNQLGFIAQEIEDIFPKSVFTNSYNSDELNIPDMLSIDIGQINYALYGAAKKLIKMNNDKELRLKRLEKILDIRRETMQP